MSRTAKVGLLAACLAFATVGFVTVFGQNLRAIFAGSASSLGGDGSSLALAGSPSAHTTARKSLSRSFSNQEESAVPEPMQRYEEAPALAANGWAVTEKDALSTFAADVDTASYTLARRALREGSLPNRASVRVEEFVNYFHYRYAPPTEEAFAVHADLAPSPFDSRRHFLRIGVQGKEVALRDRKPVHLTFLVDVSGSMQSADRLPLAKQALKLLVKNLRETDTVALVTYAGATRVVLANTNAAEREAIDAAIDSLVSGGGTAMGSGVELAYENAVRMLHPGEISRVVVLSDGDANIGNASHEQILKTISSHVQEGVTLSTVGFGVGNYRDRLMEQLADKGNGNNFYVDSLKAARRVFEENLTGTLEVIAKDVKLQVAFDPHSVKRYRLVGYENRDVADNAFRDDKVDGGEIGAGHTVTALYEVELDEVPAKDIAEVHVRAKAPNGDTATERVFAVPASGTYRSFDAASDDFKLALVAGTFADALRGNAEVSFGALEELAAKIERADDDVMELKELIRRAAGLSGARASR